MSGVLSQIIGRADIAASLLFGGSDGVVLGPVEFQDMETPEQITWGGQQQTTVHKFPGGVRVIDAMGRDDMPLSWSGIFIDNPEIRARAIDELRISGEAVSLTWRDFSYTVIVTQFECDTRAFHSPYRITCTVLSDDTAAANDSEPTILQQIGADLNDALGFNVADTVSSALQVGQQAVGVLTVLTGGSSATLALQGYLGTAQLANNTANAAASSRIVNSTLATTSDPAAAISGTSRAVSDTGTASAGQAASGYIGRAINNLAGAF
jgi:hypothetical protein